MSPRCLSSCQDVSRCIVYVSASPPATQLLVAAVEKCEMFEPPDNVYHVSPDFDGATSPESSSESWLILTNLSPHSRHLWSAAFSAHGVVIKYSTHAKLRRYLKIFAMTAAIIKLQPTKTSLLIRIAHKLDNLLFRSGRISSVYIVGWLLLVGCHTFSKFVYFECCSVVMMVY